MGSKPILPKSRKMSLLKHILFHEVNHMKYRKHDKVFWASLSKIYENPQIAEKELTIYWFGINRITGISTQ